VHRLQTHIPNPRPPSGSGLSRRPIFRDYLVFAIGGALMLAGCSTAMPVNPPPIAVAPVPPALPAAPVVRKPSDSGVVTASWYGSELAGHRTSNGERFDPNRMTAASKTLPLGSIVRVTNPNNGKSVDVRITDRGPYVGGRSIDLSRGAARKIGITKKGVARVKISRPSESADTSTASVTH
jgi:hypothetical protein